MLDKEYIDALFRKWHCQKSIGTIQIYRTRRKAPDQYHTSFFIHQWADLLAIQEHVMFDYFAPLLVDYAVNVLKVNSVQVKVRLR